MRVSAINNYNYLHQQQPTKNKNINTGKTVTNNPTFGIKYYCPYNFGESYGKTFEKITNEKNFSTVYPDLTNAVTHLLREVRFVPGVKLASQLTTLWPFNELEDCDSEKINSFLSIDKIFNRLRNHMIATKTESLVLASKNNGERLVNCYSTCDNKYVTLEFYPQERRADLDQKLLITGKLAKKNEYGKEGNSFELTDMWGDSLRSFEFWPTNLERNYTAPLKEYTYSTSTNTEKAYFYENGSPREFRNFLSDIFGI